MKKNLFGATVFVVFVGSIFFIPITSQALPIKGSVDISATSASLPIGGGKVVLISKVTNIGASVCNITSVKNSNLDTFYISRKPRTQPPPVVRG